MRRSLWGLVCFLSLNVAVARADLGEAEAQRLRANLTAFYEPARWPGGDWRKLEDERFSGLGSVFHILDAVIKHKDDASKGAQRRNVHLLEWAVHLSLHAGPSPELGFVRTQLGRQLGVLIERYAGPSRAREAVVLLLDTLFLWSPAQLPLLTREAGRAGGEAEWFAQRALRMLAETDNLALRREVAEIVRGYEVPYTDAHWALLVQSGEADREELSRLVTALAVRYSVDPNWPEVREASHPLHEVIAAMMDGYSEGDEIVQRAVQLAWTGLRHGDRNGPNYQRRLDFFHELNDGTLLADDEESNEPTPPPPPPAPPDVRIENNNVYYVKCDAWLGRGR